MLTVFSYNAMFYGGVSMNEQLINFMLRSEKSKFQIKEAEKTTNSFIKSVQTMLEQDRK